MKFKAQLLKPDPPHVGGRLNLVLASCSNSPQPRQEVLMQLGEEPEEAGRVRESGYMRSTD